MESFQAYVPLVNPDGRPLPTGWTQHYDPQRNIWIYLDMNVLPPVASLIHPAGFIANALSITAPSPTRSNASPELRRQEQPTTVPNMGAIQAPSEQQEKTLAQQLYSSALSRKPKQPEASGGNARTPSPYYDMEDAAPAYSSTDPSTFAYAPGVVSSTNTGARPSMASGSTSSHVPHPPTSSASSGSRRPLPAPPPARSRPSSTAPPVSPPPFHGDNDLVQPTPLKAPNGHFHDGDRGNLADALLQAIPELDATSPSASIIRDRRYDLGQQASGLRSKPPSYSTATRPLALRDRGVAKPPPLPINDGPTAFPCNGSRTPADEYQRVEEPQDDSDLIPPNSASTISPDPSPVYIPGVPEESILLPQSRASTPSLASFPLSATSPACEGADSPSNNTPSALPISHDGTVSPVPEPQSVPSEIPKRPPRNAFVPAQIMAIANRNMQASVYMGQNPDAAARSSSQAHTPLPRSTSSVPPPTQTEWYAARDVVLSAQDGLADSSKRLSVATSLSPMASQSSLGHHANSVTSTPDLVQAPSGSPLFSGLGPASGASTKKEGMGVKFKKLGFGIGKAAGKGFAALKRPSAMSSSTSVDAHGDGQAVASRSNARLYMEKRLPMPPPHAATSPVDHLPSLIEDVRIASPTLSAIPLLFEENSPNPRPQSLYAQTSSLNYHRKSYSHEPPVPSMPNPSQTSITVHPCPVPRELDSDKTPANLGQEHRNIPSLSRTNTDVSGSSESRSIPSNESSHSGPQIPALRAIEAYPSVSSLPLQQPYPVYGDSGPSQKGRNAANILASLGPRLGHDPPRKTMSSKAANLTAHLGALGPQHPPLQASCPSGLYSNHSTPSVSSTSNVVNKAALMFGPPQWTHRSGSSR